MCEQGINVIPLLRVSAPFGLDRRKIDFFVANLSVG